MSSPERLMKLGDLVEARKKYKQLLDRGDGIASSIRLALYVRSGFTVLDVDTERVSNYSRELEEVIDEAKVIRSGIRRLEDELGE